MILRVGVSRSLRRLRKECEAMNAPMMMSAGSCWRDGRFRVPVTMRRANIALDSAGFVAMTVHGGKYPWTIAQYLDLVEALQPVWYASMDFCVEPQIAKDESEVLRRIEMTAERYHDVCAVAASRGMPLPVPVLQGWTVEQYEHCVKLLGPLPALVGVGSVCRRPLRGPDGLLSVLGSLSGHVSAKAHAFGVKGSVLPHIKNDEELRAFVVSCDSHAWDWACASRPRTLDGRMAYLRQWYATQTRGER